MKNTPFDQSMNVDCQSRGWSSVSDAASILVSTHRIRISSPLILALGPVYSPASRVNRVNWRGRHHAPFDTVDEAANRWRNSLNGAFTRALRVNGMRWDGLRW